MKTSEVKQSSLQVAPSSSTLPPAKSEALHSAPAIKRERAISYARFSSSQQQATSIERQQAQAEKYCSDNNLELLDSISDQGISAFKGKNLDPDAALGQLLQMIQSGEIPTPVHLIVESLDRLSRQAVNTVLPLFMNLINAGVTVHTLTDRQVYSVEAIQGNWTQLIVSLAVMARAHDESLVKSERQKAYWKRVFDSKKVTGGQIPAFMHKTDSGIELHPERCSAVLKVIDMCISGTGIRTIIKQLNEQEIPAFTKSGRWTVSYIGVLLRNPALLGHYAKIDDRPYPEKWKRDFLPALIDEDKWHKLQASLNKNKKNRGARVVDPYANLLVGLSFCSLCSAPMHHQKTKNQMGKVFYYIQCRDSLREGTCQRGSFRKTEVERALFKALAKHMLSTGYQHKEVIEIQNELDKADQQLQEIHAMQGRITEALMTAPDVAALANKLQELQVQADVIRQHQQDLQSQIVNVQKQNEIQQGLKTNVAKTMLSARDSRQEIRERILTYIERVDFNFNDLVMHVQYKNGKKEDVKLDYQKFRSRFYSS
ncbi:recombinase family protein [Endozoicomonas sp. SCSIO W0465]|uniref:recombinase family protein n=1 Tax=Endozoicomonas sp. SCSIO W0465 TaxID=2918516 RepID=UPI002074BF4A|nr:recombinase family protein [Endozoicomonas sp. SCSIO W0465]USE39501.1 recombinase family protein [Endozoicomonas sp. SCSIO W0465]